jgi:hypothetical protein
MVFHSISFVVTWALTILTRSTILLCALHITMWPVVIAVQEWSCSSQRCDFAWILCEVKAFTLGMAESQNIERKEAAVAMRQCGKRVSAATNKHATIEELLEVMLRHCSKDHWQRSASVYETGNWNQTLTSVGPPSVSRVEVQGSRS